MRMEGEEERRSSYGNLSGHVDGEADRVVPLDRRGAVRRPTELSLLLS